MRKPVILIKRALRTPQVKKTIQLLLDHSSEIKHEDTICSLISAELRQQDLPAKRKAYSPKRGKRKARCVDMLIDQQEVEAKYHFEGDLVHVARALAKRPRYKAKGSRTAPKDVRSELRRATPSYFLWMVCIRSKAELESERVPYKLPELVRLFYREKIAKQSRTVRQATKAAEAAIDRRLLPLFKQDAKRRRIRPDRLPTIHGRHSSLIFRLYHLSKGNAK